MATVVLLFLLCNHLPCAVVMAAGARYQHQHQHDVVAVDDNNKEKYKKTLVAVDHASLSVLGIHKVSPLLVFQKEHYGDDHAAIKVMIDWSGLEFTIMGRQQQAVDDDDDTFLDLVIVKVPEKCLGGEDADDDCNCVGIGVPAMSNEPTMQYCCTPQTARDDGACTEQNFGHLLFNPDTDTANTHVPGGDDGISSSNYHRLITFSAREDGMDPDNISTTFMGTNEVDGTTPIYERRRRDTGELITEETPLPGSSSFSIHNKRKSHVYLHEPGTYMTIFANCNYHLQHNQQQHNVQIHGNIIWQVQPDEQVTLMSKVSAFHISIAMGYGTLLVWFYNLLYNTTTTKKTKMPCTTTTTRTRKSNDRHSSFMVTQQQPRTMPGEWILVAIGVGLAEALLRAVQYHVWAVLYSGGGGGGNHHHRRHAAVGGNMALVAMLMGAAKQSLGRHVMLLIGLDGCGEESGTATTTTNNNNKMFRGGGSFSSWPRWLHWIIIALSTAFFLATASYDFLIWVAGHYPEHKDAAYHAMSTVTSYQFRLQGIFIIAIPTALCRSMSHLKKTNNNNNNKQDTKKRLQQYRLLLAIVVGGLLWTVGTFAWFLLTSYDDTEMDVHESNQMDFFVMLTLVAVVCRPNPHQKQQQASGDLRNNYCSDEESGGMKLHDSSPLGQKSGVSFSKWDNDPWNNNINNNEEDPLPSLKATSY